MVARGWGRVINLGSILSVIAIPGRAPYASSKAGIVGLTKVLALEWAGSGVTCNAICPGPFATDMNRQLLNDPVAYQQFISQIPLGRWGELDEMAGPAVFLASEASSFITGTLAVRGRRLDGAVDSFQFAAFSFQLAAFSSQLPVISPPTAAESSVSATSTLSTQLGPLRVPRPAESSRGRPRPAEC